MGVLAPLELQEHWVVLRDLVVLDYQHFKEMMEFLHLMEILDQHLEDILLVAEEEQQILLDLEEELVEQAEVVLEQFFQYLLVLLELLILAEAVVVVLQTHLELVGQEVREL